MSNQDRDEVHAYISAEDKSKLFSHVDFFPPCMSSDRRPAAPGEIIRYRHSESLQIRFYSIDNPPPHFVDAGHLCDSLESIYNSETDQIKDSLKSIIELLRVRAEKKPKASDG